MIYVIKNYVFFQNQIYFGKKIELRENETLLYKSTTIEYQSFLEIKDQTYRHTTSYY